MSDYGNVQIIAYKAIAEARAERIAELEADLAALRESARWADDAEAKLKAMAGFVRWWDVGLHSDDCDIGTVDGCVCGTADNDRARAEALRLLGMSEPMPAPPEPQAVQEAANV